MQHTEKILARLVQEGIVTAVDSGRCAARVKFLATGIFSDWLPVLQHRGAKVEVETAQSHSHQAALSLWLPKVNERVLVLYLPCEDSGGYILGGI